MNQSDSNLVSSAEQILGYHFGKPSLLKHALTHASYSNGTISYQLLEFVGDAALNLAMTNYFNGSYKNLRPGDISMLRSANVSNEKLARGAVRHHIYPLVRINCPKLDKMVKKFTEAVKQKPEDEIYGGSTRKAPKVLADVVEAIAGAIYQDCKFNLDMMWEVVKRLLEPLITPDNFAEHKVTALTQFCEKNGKVHKFDSSRNGKTTIFEVYVDNEKVGYGSSKNKCIAKLNAARDALKKLNGEKSKHKHIVKLNVARDALEKLNREKSNLLIKLHKEVEDKEAKQKSVFEAPTIPHSQHQPILLNSLPSLSFSSPHEEIETKERKEHHYVGLRPTKDERDKIEEVRKEAAAKQKLNELCMKRHCPPPEYQSETERMNTEGEKGKGKGHVADPPQHQPPPGLTASPRPAPGYNVTVEGRERRERRLPCCGIDSGWLLFILGFFLVGIPWCIGAKICYSRVDYRKKPGYICCTIAVVLAIICWVDMINNWSDKKELIMNGDFMLL